MLFRVFPKITGEPILFSSQQIRLKAKSIENAAEDIQESGETVKKIKFRNYQPKISKPEEKLAAPTLNEETPPAVAIEQKVLGPLDIIKQELNNGASKDTNIIPRKANWDLKNQVASKLQKLRKRTQRAIVDILKEKLLAEKNHANSDLDSDID